MGKNKDIREAVEAELGFDPPGAGGSPEGAYPPGERRSEVFDAARSHASARSGAGGRGRRHPSAGAAVSG